MSCLAWICRLRNTDHTSTLTDFQKYSSFGLDDLLKVFSTWITIWTRIYFPSFTFTFHSSWIFTCHLISWSTTQEQTLQRHRTARPGKVTAIFTSPSNYNEGQFCQTNDVLLQETEKFLNTSLQSSLFLSSPLPSPRPKTKVLCKWTRNPSHTDSVQICNITSSISSFPVDLWQVLYDCMCKFPIIAMSCFSNVLKDLLSKQNTTK